MISLLARRWIPRWEEVQDPAVRRGYGVLCGAVGIGLNLLLFAGKLFAGLASGSVSITADAFNNLSDAGSSVVTLLGFKLAAQKPDRDHPFGHGRMEYISGLSRLNATPKAPDPVAVAAESISSAVEKAVQEEFPSVEPVVPFTLPEMQEPAPQAQTEDDDEPTVPMEAAPQSVYEELRRGPVLLQEDQDEDEDEDRVEEPTRRIDFDNLKFGKDYEIE